MYLIPLNWELLEELIVAQQLEKLSTFNATRKFIPVYERTRQLSTACVVPNDLYEPGALFRNMFGEIYAEGLLAFGQRLGYRTSLVVCPRLLIQCSCPA